MPFVLDPPVSPSAEPPSDDSSNLWELLYAALTPLNDPDPDEALLKWCQALCAPLQPAYDLVRERDDRKGFSIVFDVDECPAFVLPYIAQYVGAVLTPEMTEEQQRNEIREPTGWKRGQEPSIRIVAQRGLTGSKRVILRPRTPAPGECYIRTLKSETPDEAKTYLDLRRHGVPAWELLDYEAFDGPTYTDMLVAYPTYADRLAALPLYEDVPESTLP